MTTEVENTREYDLQHTIPAHSPDESAKLELDLEVASDRVRDFFGLSFSAVQEFVHMLEDEGEIRGLIGPREITRLWSRHVMNSAALLDFLPSTGSVLDIGAGSGFPGLIIAMARPDLEVHLAESMRKRCEWLADVIGALGIENTIIHNERAENLHGKLRTDIVTARAVANLSKLIRLSSKLIAPKGHLLALKGRRAKVEIDEAKYELKKHHLNAVAHEISPIMGNEPTYVVVCERA